MGSDSKAGHGHLQTLYKTTGTGAPKYLFPTKTQKLYFVRSFYFSIHVQ